MDTWKKMRIGSVFLVLIVVCGTLCSATTTITLTDRAGLPYDGISYPVGDTLVLEGDYVNTVVPPVRNVMVWNWTIAGPVSYGPINEQDTFQRIDTPGTYTVRLTVTLDNGSQEESVQEIVFADDSTEYGLVPDFTFSVDRITETRNRPLDVTLIDQSQLSDGTMGSSVGESVTNWYWVVDGERVNADSTRAALPIQMDSGRHTVGLRIDTSLGRKAYIEKEIQILPNIPGSNPVVSITADIGEMVPPLSVPLTVRYSAQASVNGYTPEVSQSLVKSWEWDLGVDPVNGKSIRVFQQNPTYTYEIPGTYAPQVRCILYDGTVSPWVSFSANQLPWIDATGSFTVGPPLRADFYWEPIKDNPTSGYLIKFYDVSSSLSPAGITQWDWNFGDGKTTRVRAGEDPNVTHLFKEPRTYTVTLGVSDEVNPPVDGVTTKSYNINVLEGYEQTSRKPSTGNSGLIQASFVANLVAGSSNTFSFADRSFGPITTWSWDFGDGSEPSHEQTPPDHQYLRAGTYRVVLTVAGDEETDSTSRIIGVR